MRIHGERGFQHLLTIFFMQKNEYIPIRMGFNRLLWWHISASGTALSVHYPFHSAEPHVVFIYFIHRKKRKIHSIFNLPGQNRLPVAHFHHRDLFIKAWISSLLAQHFSPAHTFSFTPLRCDTVQRDWPYHHRNAINETRRTFVQGSAMRAEWKHSLAGCPMPETEARVYSGSDKQPSHNKTGGLSHIIRLYWECQRIEKSWELTYEDWDLRKGASYE